MSLLYEVMLIDSSIMLCCAFPLPQRGHTLFNIRSLHYEYHCIINKSIFELSVQYCTSNCTIFDRTPTTTL
jgi:hypothetical protein